MTLPKENLSIRQGPLFLYRIFLVFQTIWILLIQTRKVIFKIQECICILFFRLMILIDRELSLYLERVYVSLGTTGRSGDQK